MTTIKELLTSEPESPAGYYLQEILKTNFVEPIRRHFSIKYDIFNEIRNYLLDMKPEKIDVIFAFN